jgi:hypothetical protein
MYKSNKEIESIFSFLEIFIPPIEPLSITKKLDIRGTQFPFLMSSEALKLSVFPIQV